ncbi:MAG: ATP-dependent DNA helicase RecG [Candidatus Eisenbacteria bacterium]|uniref:Probable DNA 3'-5' helicase RecG n=1 Tax=Eiseniibacteriota bacterium TaxID=2212470 RepID=A0A938BLU4_UNCEI|nr:ATP-dependent DNA helicase RecG [Candidatus Eisenbacteria bacterium]
MIDPADSLRYLKGAGPARARLLERLELRTLGDLLEHYPRAYLDRTRLTPLGQLQPGGDYTAAGMVSSVAEHRSRGGRSSLHALLDDGTGRVECVWFNQPYLRERLRRGTRVLLSGRVEVFQTLRFVNPEFEVVAGPGGGEGAGAEAAEAAEAAETAEAAAFSAPGIVPVYPLTAGITQRVLRRLVRQALADCAPALAEFLPADILSRQRLPAWGSAVRGIHFPDSQEDCQEARRRIAFQELFDLQLLLACSRSVWERPQTARPLASAGRLLAALERGLPFRLTGAQHRAIARLREDLARDRPMHRLLEGDVGSGKTLVALAAALCAVEAGAQVAVMAPTEILAAQHAATFARHAEALGVRTALLTGGLSCARAREVREQVARGDVQILLGTQALIQETVAFASLGFVVIDEQHRFGVLQRARLLGKGSSPHALWMSATPIPRTLALTLFGDLDISLLDEKPPGRRPPRTHVVPRRRYAEMLDYIARELDAGGQSYFVCPAIEASETLDLRAAEELFARLQGDSPLCRFRGALLHGRLRAEEKSRAMEGFAQGETAFLVATTVVEVGMDVPNANLMVIEHPERYGLSQLHQLRGRVGRGRQPAHVFLIEPAAAGPEARARIEALVREEDGLRIAEEDLRQRGPGDFFGVRQSGLPPFKVADPVGRPELLEAARDEAFALVGREGVSGLRSTALWRRLMLRFGDSLDLYGIG